MINKVVWPIFAHEVVFGDPLEKAGEDLTGVAMFYIRNVMYICIPNCT